MSSGQGDVPIRSKEAALPGYRRPGGSLLIDGTLTRKHTNGDTFVPTGTLHYRGRRFDSPGHEQRLGLVSSHRTILDPLLAVIAKAHARRQYRQFVRAVQDASAVQHCVLLDRIRISADSTFGREHDLAGIRSYEDFVARVPVQAYEAIEPYVRRVMAGDTRAMFGPSQRVRMFATTSGTTSSPKYLPVTDAFLSEYRRGWNVFGIKALLDHPSGFVRPILQIVSSLDEHRSESGLPCGAISGLLAATQKRVVRRYYLIPPIVGEIGDAEARYYTIMRLAVPCDVGWMVTASPATPVKLARSAAAHAERLIRDVRDGALDAPGEIQRSVRETLQGHLRPDRATASRLAALAERHGELLPKHYWRLAFMANWMGGTLSLHLTDFPHYFGDTPVRDIGLLATEGRVSIPLEDGTPAGVLDVVGSFFEFLDPEADPRDPSAIHRCHEVEVGREYRVVMTTSAGFYRYDIGDHVRVRGWMGEAPIVEFLHRGAHVSSITGEKLTEWQVTRAFGQACESVGERPESFLLAPVWADPPFYRLHLDHEGGDPARLATAMDGALAEANLEYGSKRSSHRLGPVTPHRLPPGALAALDAERLRRRGGSNEQYKHQYLYTTPGQDDDLVAQTAAGAAANIGADAPPGAG